MWKENKLQEVKYQTVKKTNIICQGVTDFSNIYTVHRICGIFLF